MYLLTKSSYAQGLTERLLHEVCLFKYNILILSGHYGNLHSQGILAYSQTFGIMILFISLFMYICVGSESSSWAFSISAYCRCGWFLLWPLALYQVSQILLIWEIWSSQILWDKRIFYRDGVGRDRAEHLVSRDATHTDCQWSQVSDSCCEREIFSSEQKWGLLLLLCGVSPEWMETQWWMSSKCTSAGFVCCQQTAGVDWALFAS